MSAVVNALSDAFNAVIDAIEDLVDAVWDAVVEPILEAVFALFGIEDETVVTVQHLSSPIYATNLEDVYQAGIVRAVIAKVRTDTSFFPNYMEQIFKTKGRLRAYFRYGELDLYINGLPEFEVKGMRVDFDDVQAALDEVFGSTHTVLSVTSHNPNRFEHFFYVLQDSPEFYQPWTNTLTNTDIYGATRDGWFLDDITYNSGPDDYTVAISRDMETAEFLIEGPIQITEGDTATFTIRSNRTIPAGYDVDINFTYAGTAVNGVDYTQVASVTMLENTNEITVDLVTAETANANRTIAITIDTITNGVFGDPTFEHVVPAAQSTANCVITDDDSLVLTLNDVVVKEANTTITINVKLEQAAPSGAFTVDYAFTDLGGITGGVDYDNTGGTLNFAGTLGEVQSFNVDIYADIVNDDREQFEAYLTNSSDVDGINISLKSTVTIIDETGDPAQGVVNLADTQTHPPYVVEDSLIVVYSDDSGIPGEFYYWIYPHSDLTYDLRPQNVVIKDLEMMPMAILRKNKTNIDVSPGTASPTYRTTRLLMQRIAFDITEFLDAIAANPDIGDIDDAYLNFSTQPKDTNKIVSLIMYKQWEQLLITSGLQSNVDEYHATLKEGDIENAIVWKRHIIRIGEIGVVTAEGEYIHYRSGTTLFLQYQRTATNYDEIEIQNLNGMASINYQSYHEVALMKLGDDEFTFPVSWKILNDMSAREQMEVFQYIARIDFNAVLITELEWYETEAFFDLFEFALTVIYVVAVIASFGAATGPGATFLTGALAVIELLVVNYAIGELIIFVAEATGNDVLAALAGVAAAVYLTKPELLSSETLMQAETLLDLATDFADNLLLLESIEAQEIAADLLETAEEAAAKIEEEKNKRGSVEAVALDSQFLVALQSVDTNYFPAIQGQYNYDQMFNYDSLVGNYHNQQLQIGVR